MINEQSLSQTLDSINQLVFEKRELPPAEREQVAQWIAARQGLPGAYADTFAGFPPERANGITVFTGERVTSASARHILGEEASRALRLLRVRDPSVQAALVPLPRTARVLSLGVPDVRPEAPAQASQQFT